MRAMLPKAPPRGAFFVVVLAVLAWLGPTAAAERVRHVIDGDTIILQDGTHVRLIGINTPELDRDGRPAEPLAAEARALTRRLTEGTGVRLGYGPERRDHYGRLLAHVYTGEGDSLQQALLEAGLAAAVAVPPNVSRTGEYFAAERRARNAGRGIWSHPWFRPRDAADVNRDVSGFVFLSGRLEASGRSRRYRYYLLSGRVSVRISHEDWRRYWQQGALPGAPVVLRGWLGWRDGRPGIRIGHPAMLEILEP